MAFALILLPVHLCAQPVEYGKNGINYRIEACSDRIIRIRVSPHHANFGESLLERYSIINAKPLTSGVEINESSDDVRLSTGALTVTLDKNDCGICIEDASGAPITGKIIFHKAASDKCIRLASIINGREASTPANRSGSIIGDDESASEDKNLEAEAGDPSGSSAISIGLKDNEKFYGGGSTSREHIQHRGEILRMWTTYQKTEIPIPFLMSSSGWGIYLNSTRKSFFDVACTEDNCLNIYHTGQEVDFFIMAGGDMPGVLKQYTGLTGSNYLLPKWAYGLCFGPNMKEDQWDILNDAVRFRECGVPCSVFWLEPQWMDKHYDFSTSKKWNYERFTPEYFFREKKWPKQYYPSLFIGRLNDLGYHLGLWICADYDLSIAEEDAIAQASGAALSGQEHWMNHLTTFIDMGAEGFKLDPARTINDHTGRNYYNGCGDDQMHNLNQVLLPKQLNQMYRKHTGKRGWFHYCAGWSGTQHWGASTSGDNGGGRTALFDQLNLGNSGFMNTSCDVMYVSEEQKMQSLHFGTFLPWMQINSWCSMFQPFYCNREDRNIYRDYIRLRYSLLPYIYSLAIEGVLTGMPIVRSMPLCFPEDRQVDDMWTQYMFGPSLCVGIFTDEIYLPEGEWIDAWNGETVKSRGEIFKRPYPRNKAGILMIRNGSIIPKTDPDSAAATDIFSRLTLEIHPCGKSSFTLYDCDEESYAYEQGLISSTVIDCNASSKSIDIVVHPVKGSFENMPPEKDYVFCVFLDHKPSKVLVNGRKTHWKLNGRAVEIEVKSHNTNEYLTVTIL